MQKENIRMSNTIKYSIWDTRTNKDQPTAGKIPKNQQKDLNQEK